MSEQQSEWTELDRQQVLEDLGREPRGVVGVAARCVCGRPLVVTTSPRLPDGTPFPTMFYMTSPVLTAACSTLEAEHRMEQYNRLLAADSPLAKNYEEAHRDYLSRRGLLGDVEEISGVSAGGMPTRVKCLHALVGHSLASGSGVNPIGDMALEELAQRGLWAADRCYCRISATTSGDTK